MVIQGIPKAWADLVKVSLKKNNKNKNKTLTTIPKLRQGKDISKASIIHEAIEHEDGHQQSVLLITSNPKINLCNLNFELHNM